MPGVTFPAPYRKGPVVTVLPLVLEMQVAADTLRVPSAPTARDHTQLLRYHYPLFWMIWSLIGSPVESNSWFPRSPSVVMLYKYHLPTELQTFGKSKPIASLGKDAKHSSKEKDN